MSLYRNILLNALKISWRNKYLWIFGVFASFLSTSGGYEMMINALKGEESAYAPGIQGFIESGLFSRTGFAEFKLMFASADISAFASTIFIGLIVIVLSLFVLWISVVSQVAVVKETAVLTKSNKTKVKSSDNLARLIKSGMSHFWQVFSINLTLKIILSLFFVLVSAPLFVMVGKETGYLFELLFIVIFVLFLGLTLAISFVAKYAIVANVTRDLSIIKSIKLGFNIFINNWIISLELAFILFSLNFVVGLALMLFILILVIPLYFLSFLLLKLTGVVGFWLIVVPGVLAIFIFITIIGAVLTCFQIGSWTGLFIKLISKKEQKSKVLRVIEGIKK